MPPRNRKTAPVETPAPETDSSPESSDGSTTDTTETPETTASRRKKREALTGKDAVILSDFAVAEAGEAPGKQYSEPRDNPFDTAVKDSYEKDLEKDDKYLKFVTKTDAVENQARLIRASAAYFKIGSKIRVQDNGDGTATVFFRGQQRRAKKKADTTEVDTNQPVDENTDDHEQENVPAA